jgi:Tol biopolymer transport system component
MCLTCGCKAGLNHSRIQGSDMGERMRRVISRQASRALLIAGAVLTGLSCGNEDITSPGRGVLEVTTSTTGVEPDQDGYALQMDAAQVQTIGPAATVRITEVEPGNHVLELGGATGNCAVNGENPRPVNVVAGETATVDFQVTCSATRSSLQVSSNTTGPSPDPDGYRVTIDGVDQGTLAQNDDISLTSLEPGTHLIGLGGVTGNCEVEGDNPRSITLSTGGSIEAAFEVTCAPPPVNAGAFRLAITTIGPDQDQDGFTFTVDEGGAQPIGTSATATLDNLAVGSHSVRLSSIAGNCTVLGDNPRTVTVSSENLPEVRFEVICHAATGSIRVSITSSGDAPDPDGYVIRLDAVEQQPVPVNGTVSFEAVPAGTHTVALLEASSHCSMAEPAERRVTVTVGVSSEVGFTLTCVASTGGIQLSTRTTGRSLNQDDYLVSVDGGASTQLRPNDVHVFGGLAPGGHAITVSGLPPDCRLEGENPLTVTVLAGYMVPITVTVTCSLSGGKIAFESSRDGDEEIYVMNPDGSGQTRLTNSPGQDFSPTWSPDASKIAFVSSRDGNYDIYVMNADGSAVTNLTNTTNTEDNQIDNKAPNWSPDGTKIAFESARDGRRAGIWVMNSDGTDPTQLTDGGERAPAWSPDNKKIAVRRERNNVDRGDGTFGGTTDIVVMNADGTDQVQIFTTIIACALHLEWSPDGSQISFNGCDYTWSIQLIQPDGSGLTQLLVRDHNNEHPTWSPDGGRIAFSSDFGELRTYIDIYVMNADGTGLTQLTDSPAYDYNPVWSR